MAHSMDLEQRLLAQIMSMPAIDVHSHVPAAQPYARSLRELLGYHYYTELAHSAGLEAAAIAPDVPDERMIPELLAAMERIENTVQYSWMVELARELFGFEGRRLAVEGWERLDEAVRERAAEPGRARRLLELARIERVFLTNEFDEDLSGVDRALFVPSLRADTLVFRFHLPEVRRRLCEATGVEVSGAAALREALGRLVERFRAAGALSAAISLPPGFRTAPTEQGNFERALDGALRGREQRGDLAVALHSGILFELVGSCRDCALPVQLMCGALRDAYEHGVPQGTDLPQAGESLSGLLPLLNAFPGVTFCLSVLSESQAQELAAYGWIVHNVVLSGHWWYCNVPAQIERDLATRLQSVPRTKLIGYYSDMYKLEFGLAKFNMYRRALARVLARDWVEVGLGSEEEALELARLLLRENAAHIFGL